MGWYVRNLLKHHFNLAWGMGGFISLSPPPPRLRYWFYIVTYNIISASGRESFKNRYCIVSVFVIYRLILLKSFSIILQFYIIIGQHIGDDMADSRRITCPNEYLNVIIPSDDDVNSSNLDISERVIPIYRSKYLPNTGASNAPRTFVCKVFTVNQ